MRKLWKPLAVALVVATGVYAAEINDLSTTDASNTARFPEGMAPSAVNNAARALEGLLARWFADQNGSLSTSGSADTYTISANQTIGAYYDGLKLSFEVTPTNTGASTLNVDSVGADSIVKHGDQALEAGDLQQGQKYTVIHDGTNWQLVSPTTATSGSITSGNVPLFSGDDGKLSDSGADELSDTTLTTQGDVLYRDGSGLQRLAIGTADQRLVVNDGATAPEWEDISGAISAGSELEDTTTTIDFENLASDLKRITVQFVNVSMSGTDEILLQLGDSGGVEEANYVSTAASVNSGDNDSTTGCILTDSSGASDSYSGQIILTLEDSSDNTWVATGTLVEDSGALRLSACTKSLSATLDRIRLKGNSTNTFDAGVVNILVE